LWLNFIHSFYGGINKARSRLSHDGINNHGLIMYTKGAREQNTIS
jgi:hypothetical protein